MNRRVSSAWFGILLLLSQILQGGLAAAVPCPDDFNDFVVCGAAVQEDCAAGDHVRAVHSHTNPAPTHCKFGDSGACRTTHAPALSIALSPMLATLPQAVEASPPRVEHLAAPLERILRPPK